MKKTLKIVGISIASVTIAIILVIGGYYLIQKNKTYYIYDLRIVNPANASHTSYIINSLTGTSEIGDMCVYMSSSNDNIFEVCVYANASSNLSDISVYSSNPSVANVYIYGSKCYIRYFKAGETTITAKLATVTDSFTLYVYDKTAAEFNVYDKNYYSNFSSKFANDLYSYTDGTEYQYDFETESIFGISDSDGEIVNNGYLRIDQKTVNNNVFEYIKIDSSNSKIKIKCKENWTKNTDESFIVQSYYMSDYGEEKVYKNYMVNVHIVTCSPEFIQIVLGTSPNFEDSCVLTCSSVVNLSNNWESETKERIQNFLSYQREVENLKNEGMTPVFDCYFTEKVSKIYLKFRLVYTNREIVYLDDSTVGQYFNSFSVDTGISSNFKKDQSSGVYVLDFSSSNYFDSNTSLTITAKYKLDESSPETTHDFNFSYKSLNEDNITCFYEVVKDDNDVFSHYVYKYWDYRSNYYCEITDAEGKIIGFDY